MNNGRARLHMPTCHGTRPILQKRGVTLSGLSVEGEPRGDSLGVRRGSLFIFSGSMGQQSTQHTGPSVFVRVYLRDVVLKCSTPSQNTEQLPNVRACEAAWPVGLYLLKPHLLL